MTKNLILVFKVKRTLKFSVSATANNPYTASDVANETAKVFQNKIKK